jgi:hypothetical protein
VGLHRDEPAERHVVCRGDEQPRAPGLRAPGGRDRGFSKTYGLQRLACFEEHETILGAIQREKALKRWLRAWKVRLIMTRNPDWVDLYDLLG